jgi:hypothetical protein
MSISVLSNEQVAHLMGAGVPAKELPIMEDLVRALLPYNRHLNVFEEAWAKYKQIKLRERVLAEKKRKENEARLKRSMDIVKSGYIESMANGKVYSSKAAYRADIAAMGYTEVGDQDITAYANKKKKELEAQTERQADEDIEAIVAKLCKTNKIE